jgi:hypothetical protein
MGAALTYARRYALFTLVGIAGEDDLDAPDTGPAQNAHVNVAAGPGAAILVQTRDGALTGASKAGNGVSRKPLPRRCGSVLPPSESAAARETLIGELGGIASTDQLTEWAHRQMAIKNTLTVDDARAVEEAFRARLEVAAQSETTATKPTPTTVGRGTPDTAVPSLPVPARAEAATSKGGRDDPGRDASRVESPGGHLGGGIDKSVLAISEPRRYRNKEHLKFVALQACLVCGRQPSDPHHIGFTQPRALGRKVSDEFAVPLCRVHHREVHRSSNEAEWWKTYGLDPLAVASALWAQTRPARPAAQAASLLQPAPATSNPAPTAPRKGRNRKTNPIAGVVPP